MRELTIKEVIKIIPLEKATKDKLFAEYDGYDEGKQFEIVEICWNAFDDLRAAMKEKKYQEFLIEVEQEKRHFTPTFMQEVEEAVWQDLEDILSGKKEDKDELKGIRTELQKLMHD